FDLFRAIVRLGGVTPDAMMAVRLMIDDSLLPLPPGVCIEVGRLRRVYWSGNVYAGPIQVDLLLEPEWQAPDEEKPCHLLLQQPADDGATVTLAQIALSQARIAYDVQLGRNAAGEWQFVSGQRDD
ncbi:MAG: hypothetical protein AB7K09_18995, partial [Planctomycetota bacterium]